MCQQTLTCSAPATSTQTGRFCNWLLGKVESREALMSGKAARLLISVTLANGKVVANEYIVFRDGCNWRLLKEVNGRVVERYTIDCSFDEDPGTWQCDCPDFRKRHHVCKHIGSLRNSLTAIGLLNV